MNRLLIFLSCMAVLVGCSTSTKSAGEDAHDPSTVLVFANGRFVLGEYSKTHPPELIAEDLRREGVDVHHLIRIRVEAGTPKEKIAPILTKLRDSGYSDIKLE